MNNQLNQIIQAMMPIMVMAMTMGMVKPVMLQTGGMWRAKTEEERRKTHLAKYGTEEVPPRGSRLYRQSMWLTSSQRTDLERRFGSAAVRWGEEMAPVGDVAACEKLAKFFYDSFVTEIIK